MPDMSNATSQARGVSYLYMAAAFVIVVAGMRAAEAILNPLLLAIFLSIISAPAYFALLKRGMSNWLALLTVVSALSAVVVAVIFIVMGSIADFSSNADHYGDRINEEQKRLERTIVSIIPDSWKTINTPNQEDAADKEPDSHSHEELVSTDPEIAADTVGPKYAALPKADPGVEPTKVTLDDEAAFSIDSLVDDPAQEVGEELVAKVASSTPHTPSIVFPEPRTPEPATKQGYLDQMKEQFSLATAIGMVKSITLSIAQLFSNAFLILLIVIFILLEAGSFGKKLRSAVSRTAETTQRAEEIIGSVHHYIVIKTWVSLGTGFLVIIWLWSWGVSHAPLWGLLAFLFNYIPNIGSILAAIPAMLIAWLEIGGMPAVAIAVGFVVINGVVGNFIEPRLMGKSLGLSPLVIFFSMLFWGWVLGPVGMLLSVPLTMAARIALDGFDDTRWMATLMGSVE